MILGFGLDWNSWILPEQLKDFTHPKRIPPKFSQNLYVGRYHGRYIKMVGRYINLGVADRKLMYLHTNLKDKKKTKKLKWRTVFTFAGVPPLVTSVSFYIGIFTII